VSAKTSFIVFDGMDNCGKSTMMRQVKHACPGAAHIIEFKKTLPSGDLLRINTEKDFELLFSMFELLDPSKVYLLDRFVVSNLVYDKVLRGESTAVSEFYHAEFLRRFDVLEVFFTRPPVTQPFVDDRIKLTVEQFNAGLTEYQKYGTNYQVLDRDTDDQPTTRTMWSDYVFDMCVYFVITKSLAHI
jgi:GTPase SAR1 family protein